MAATPDDLRRTEAALRYAFRAVLPRLKRADGPRSFAPPSYCSGMFRTDEFIRRISREMCENPLVLAADNALSDESPWRRVERAGLDEAAVTLYGVAQVLPEPQMAVVRLRAQGKSWPEVRRLLPGRVAYSLREDHRSGLCAVWTAAADAVRRLI